ncbi:PH domain-containing protein [Nocardioides sp. CPCC 205120]|uniref:PH domain-containing protein n=1 Tax=Nocardioides sp. CPCC 205120 TaxID=3406462 RepID=UPI003B50B4DA
MPADSDGSPARPSLPRTWRPLGTRLAGFAAGGTVAAAAVAAWFLLDPEIRDRFGIFERVLMVLLTGLAVAVWWGLLRCRVTASETGLVVVNGYRRYEYGWAQVVAVRMPLGAPWATLDLSDGTSRPTLGIQSSDGTRAQVAVRELRALVDAS